MTKFSIIYDSQNKTWDVMISGKCEFYGTAEQCDNWALERKETHKELKWTDVPMFNAKEAGSIQAMPEKERIAYLYGDWSHLNER